MSSVSTRKSRPYFYIFGIKPSTQGWSHNSKQSKFAIKIDIDETVMNPRRAKLPNFVGGKQEQKMLSHAFVLIVSQL